MTKIKKVIPYILIILITAYLLPLLANDINSKLFILMILMPIAYFLNSIFYGIINSFNILYNLIIVLIMIPSIFIFFNSSAIIYILLYLIISIIGNSIGKIIHLKINYTKVFK